MQLDVTAFVPDARYESVPELPAVYLQLAANSHRLKTGYNALIAPPI
jgi:hypothetical protein